MHTYILRLFCVFPSGFFFYQTMHIIFAQFCDVLQGQALAQRDNGQEARHNAQTEAGAARHGEAQPLLQHGGTGRHLSSK